MLPSWSLSLVTRCLSLEQTSVHLSREKLSRISVGFDASSVVPRYPKGSMMLRFGYCLGYTNMINPSKRDLSISIQQFEVVEVLLLWPSIAQVAHLTMYWQLVRSICMCWASNVWDTNHCCSAPLQSLGIV